MDPRPVTIKEIESIINWDFPDIPVVKTLPFNEGDMGLILGTGTKIPHATQCSRFKKNNNSKTESNRPKLYWVLLNSTKHSMEKFYQLSILSPRRYRKGNTS